MCKPTTTWRAPQPRRRQPARLAWLACLAASAWLPAVAQPAAAPAPAQTAPPRPPAAAASQPTAATTPPAAAASAPAANPTQRIEITGGRDSDTEQRRRATASTIVIGRDEIDKFGDATLGEVLRRLPGVTTPGAPGRGGPPRMRGLGGGFTQLLIDGQRIPPGFSLESLTPEQIERIEILRAPTAETGARAIAGSINIVTREGFRRRLNDLRLGIGLENGKLSPGVNWTHNDSAGVLTYNISGSGFRGRRDTSNTTRTQVNAVDADGGSGTLLEDRFSDSRNSDVRSGLNLTTRLQWRLGDGGDMLALMPMVFHSRGHGSSRYELSQTLPRQPPLPPFTPALYDFGTSRTDSAFTNLRLGSQWRQRVGPARLELNASGGSFLARSDTARQDFNDNGMAVQRTLDDRARTRERQLTLNLKASGLVGGSAGIDTTGSNVAANTGASSGPNSNSAGGTAGAGGAGSPVGGGEHSLVAGLELDATRRNETRSTLENGAPQLVDFGDNLQASALRFAAYAQDEWAVSANWGAHAGLRWEGITTRGDSADLTGAERPTNRSSVWTPLLHAVWKPDPKSRDQVRFSLTRSYRSPPLGALIARPVISRNYPLPGGNVRAAPDSAGNPELKPELATGIDIALERYLEAGGVLSANVFHRQISNLIRSQTALETVSYSSVPRWVRRQQNIGDATTSGLELEAKFRLDQLLAGALPVEVRSNAAFFTSSVKAVPGPDNRLDEQAKATANLGADYRLRGMPLTLGGNANWVPGYTTRLDTDQRTSVSTKAVWDAYALWTFSPAAALRLLGSNLAPRDFATTTVTDALTPVGNERTTVRNDAASFVNWQLRLELKL